MDGIFGISFPSYPSTGPEAEEARKTVCLPLPGAFEELSQEPASLHSLSVCEQEGEGELQDAR